ncbi:MAG: hypothetical protein WDN03_03425 [Rhizomicrobium sp.]
MSSDEFAPTRGRSSEVHAHSGQPVPANVRAVLRVGNEFFLRCIDSMAAVAGNDLIKALVFTAIWTANVKHITNSAANRRYAGMDEIPPDALRKPVSVLAISNSLCIPYETVRRYVQTLLREGTCIRVGGKGVLVPAEVVARGSHHDAIREGVPSLLRFLTDLKRVGFDFAPYRHRLPTTVPMPMPQDGTPPPNMRAVLRVVMEMMMRGIDELGILHKGDFLYAIIFTAIWTANVRHITASSENLKYGGLTELPPDEARRPITVNAVASSLRMPYETVRRYAGKMVQDGSAVRIGVKGLIVPRERLAIEDGYESVRSVYANIERSMLALYRAGFDFSGY